MAEALRPTELVVERAVLRVAVELRVTRLRLWQEVDRRARKADVNRSEMIRMVLEKAMRKSGQ
jgi:metal-responsive CopG/Arc/MetJ family transcriptional regulator